MSYKKILNESTRIFDFVESIVRDIIKIFKTVDEGEFYLPEHFDPDKLVYTLSELSESLTVELIIEIDDEIDEFIVNSDYYRDDDVIVVLIKYNSNVHRINSQHFIPIKKNDKDWKVNIEGFKKSKNIYDDFLTKIRFYSMSQLVKYILIQL